MGVVTGWWVRWQGEVAGWWARWQGDGRGGREMGEVAG